MLVDQALCHGFIGCSFLSPFSIFYAVQESERRRTALHLASSATDELLCSVFSELTRSYCLIFIPRNHSLRASQLLQCSRSLLD